MKHTNGIVVKLSSENGINYLNIGLMVLSLVMAYIVPFKLFLFSYAVLGPLHYLTEISWLEKKNYFVKEKKDIWLLLLLCVLISIGVFYQSSKTNLLVASFLFLGFVYALLILLIENTSVKILLAFLVFVVSVVLKFNHFPNLTFLIFAVWLPTIIHVYVFTGLFILFGALKSKSKSGIISLLVFVTCALTFFIFTPSHFGIPVSAYGQNAYSFFTLLNNSLYYLFGYGNAQMSDDVLYFGEKSIMIMRFIAFAYTYHYLNWFSKTTVIKWNEVSKKRMGIIISLWIISVVLYGVDYQLGFYALFLLSMLHVFLEFPLNHRSLIGIGQELKVMLKK